MLTIAIPRDVLIPELLCESSQHLKRSKLLYAGWNRFCPATPVRRCTAPAKCFAHSQTLFRFRVAARCTLIGMGMPLQA